MNFFHNLEEETAVNMSNITVAENDCASEEQLNCNVICENNSINIEDNASDLNKTFSEHSDCIDGPTQLNYNSTSDEIQFIDFEELKATVTAENIKEFENVLSYKIPQKQNSDSVLMLSLDEVNEYLTINSENNSDNEIYNLDKRCRDNVDNKENHIDLIKQSNRCIKLEKNKYMEDMCDFEDHIICNIIKNEFIEKTNNNLLINDIIGAISSNESKYFHPDRTITQNIELQDIDDDGYNSSDFEFISENEAKLDINNNDYKISKDNIDSKSRKESVVAIKSEKNIKSMNSLIFSSCSDSSVQDNISNKEIDPGEGPSGLNRPTDGCYNEDYRENHSIPEGEDYLDLFRGQYNPVLTVSDIIFLENKSTRPSPMNVQYEGIGFDLRLMRHENEPDESEDANEAKETIKQILLEYPGENRKKRRKF